MVAEAAPRSNVDIARIGALIGDPTRARVLMVLAGGRALPASRLAAEAGVAPSTISEHLGRLVVAGLLGVRAEGRSRLFELASPAVADAIEAIARISPVQHGATLRQGSHAHALRLARTCYRHLAGRLGVALFGRLLSLGLLAGGDGLHPCVGYSVTPMGQETFAGLGIDVRAVMAKRTAVRYCLDWSEQRHHLAGPLGAALADLMFTQEWIRRTDERRVVQVTGVGGEKLAETFGLPPDWDRIDTA